MSSQELHFHQNVSFGAAFKRRVDVRRIEMPSNKSKMRFNYNENGTMTPTEILEGLRTRGRPEELRVVTATLTHLLRNNQVVRAGRGHYLAAN